MNLDVQTLVSCYNGLTVKFIGLLCCFECINIRVWAIAVDIGCFYFELVELAALNERRLSELCFQEWIVLGS